MLKIVIRSIVIYAALLLGLRMLGKRQLGELEINELVIAMLLSDIASTPLQDPELPLSYGLISAFTVLSLCFLLSCLTLKSLAFRRLFCGEPALIIRDGILQQSTMRRNRFTIDELLGELRVQGITDISTVRYAILETNGQLSIVERAENKPLTPLQMGIGGKGDTELPILLINDGVVVEKNIVKAGKSRDWLQAFLAAHGVKTEKQVFFLSIDSEENIILIRKERFTSPRESW